MVHLSLVIIECIIFTAAAGFISGVFGGGSGLLMTPGYYYVLRHFSDFSHYQMQISIATTAASSAVLGLSATRIQWKKNNIDAALLKKISPGILIGTFIAITLLNIVSSDMLKHLFGFVVISVALWFWLYQMENDHKSWSIDHWTNTIFTILIGLFWFLLGVAVFTVPYLHKCRIGIRRAVGCSTVTAMAFSAIAALLLAITGLFHIGIRHGNLGFVSITLLIISIIPSCHAAHIGAKLSVNLPQKQLKKAYAILIFVIGLLMLH